MAKPYLPYAPISFQGSPDERAAVAEAAKKLTKGNVGKLVRAALIAYCGSELAKRCSTFVVESGPQLQQSNQASTSAYAES